MAAAFEACRNRLRRIVELRLDRRVRGRLDPSDIVQDGFLLASQRFDEYHRAGELPFFVWARFQVLQQMQTAHRQHRATQKRSARCEVSPGNGVEDSSSWLLEELSSSITSPSQAVINAEGRRQLAEALERLEPLEREVLALRHFEELSNNEAALVLKIHPSAASRLYYRALEQLKAVLAKMPGFFEDLGVR